MQKENIKIVEKQDNKTTIKKKAKIESGAREGEKI